MNLVRTRGGTMIHQTGCPYAAAGVPWEWAQPQPRLAVLGIIRSFGYRTCRYCNPFNLRRQP